MFRRLTRLIKSWFGYIISFAEDPEVMLQEASEEMRNMLPRLNQVLVSTRATVIRLTDQQRRREGEEKRLLSSIQAALTQGSPEARALAEDDAATLQQVRDDRDETVEHLETAQKAHENAMIAVDEMKRKLRERIQMAQRAVEEHRRAKVMSQAAAALTQLDSYDTGATTDKYVDQVRQKSAEARAAMEMAIGEGDIKRIQAERTVRKAKAQRLLQQIESQMTAEPRQDVAKIEE
jgi:PspA/IM30 family.